MSLVGDPVEAMRLLVACGADDAVVQAARLLGEPWPWSAPKEDIEALARKARGLGAIRWSPSGRTPAPHACEALIALADGDPCVLLLGMAERISALRGAGRCDRPEALAAAHEARAVWAPLAARLGVHLLQRELEDLSFRLLEPADYDQVARLVDRRRREREALVGRAIGEVSGLLQAHGLRGSVEGRAKHLYSIQKKRLAGGGQVDLTDLFGLRVLLLDDAACYTTLGALHARWDHLARRFKDFIAHPKANGYQSLHTVVLWPVDRGAIPLEVQLRTYAMHEMAEHGAAAHYLYKRAALRRNPERAYLYALTPCGEVKRLPRGATPLDFAYAVHSAVGRGCYAARVGGKVVPLDSPLRTGDVVEILHHARSHASRGQLTRVKTSRARNRIRAALGR